MDIDGEGFEVRGCEVDGRFTVVGALGVAMTEKEIHKCESGNSRVGERVGETVESLASAPTQYDLFVKMKLTRDQFQDVEHS